MNNENEIVLSSLKLLSAVQTSHNLSVKHIETELLRLNQIFLK